MKIVKVAAILLTAGILITELHMKPVLAEVDYSEKLSELEFLMEQCEQRNIPTDYERINYAVIERFEDYINEDIQNEESFVDYNIGCIENLYSEAKTNLEGYLSGTKIPQSVTLADMNSVSTRGAGLYNGTTPVSSVGYGHFERVVQDIPKFRQFGANNIQIEIGPTTCTEERIQYILNALDNAEKNNVGVTLLLSPHYFPSNLSEEIYADTVRFIKYNVHAPEAKEVIENYLRKLIPRLKGKPALVSLCLSNEPVFDTRYFSDFYNPLFREYLKGVHGTIDSLNKAYQLSDGFWGIGKTSYDSFDEITMPEETEGGTGLKYDWVEFNDRIFADWHKWMADIVREYLPDVPLHCKVMPYFSNTDDIGKETTSRGTDIEMLGEFLDWSGCDAWDLYEDTARYYTTMFYYDYQNSVLKKPVYNSEDHIITDKSFGFDDNQCLHAGNNMWMGAMHGRNMSSIWVWDRYDDSRPSQTSDFKNSVLYRPDVVAEVGKKALDISRLSNQIARFQQYSPQYAIFYSKPSRIYDSSYIQKLFDAYKICLNSGVNVGIVSDKSISRLQEYKTLIIPNAKYCREETLTAVNEFIENGGEVIYSGDVFSKNEYGIRINNSTIIGKGKLYTESFAELINSRIKLIDEDTGLAPENFDWSHNITGSSVLVNISNIKYDDTRKIGVYLDREKLTGMTDLISGEELTDIVTVKGYTPMLLEYNIPYEGDLKIKNLKAEGMLLTWDYDGAYAYANVYKMNEIGGLLHLGRTQNTQYECTEAGTYVIKPYGADAEIITIAEEAPFSVKLDSFECSGTGMAVKVGIENITLKFSSGIVYVNLYDKNGYLVKYVYNNIALNGLAEDHFNVSLTKEDNTTYAEIGIWDSEKTKNNYSNVIVQPLD